MEAGYGDTPVIIVTLENLYLHDRAPPTRRTGSPSFATAWDWTIRNNVIERAGTGLYLGNSTGREPFIRGTIEGNLIRNTRGYSTADQASARATRSRRRMPPTGAHDHPLATRSSRRLDRRSARRRVPTCCWDTFRWRGAARTIATGHGNVFRENDSDDEPLFQGEGKRRLLRQPADQRLPRDLCWIQPHNDVPRDVTIENNTLPLQRAGNGDRGGSSMHSQVARENAIFSDDGTPVVGIDGDNFTANLVEATFLLTRSDRRRLHLGERLHPR